ncbi:MAG: aminotransferase class V-fold PLP-dependent enzyme [Spirochaetes bacterium]|nr:aminotransferase class V-fold PLP-dependent enzyme [Spirochaetota bacterium]
MSRIYLDWAASAPATEAALDSFTRIAATNYGNPSSLHYEGKAAAALLSAARSAVASSLGISQNRVYFTSGGTESCQIPLLSLLRKQHSEKTTILVSAIEHPAIFNQCTVLAEAGFTVKTIPTTSIGRVEAEKLARLLDTSVALVAIMAVNNETGIIQDMDTIAEVIKNSAGRKPFILCDTVQTAGKIPLNFDLDWIDAYTLSSHKLGGLRGAGALILRKPLQVLALGGGQEQGLRSGTENIAAIQALAVALAESMQQLPQNHAAAAALMGQLISGLRSIPGVCILPEERGAKDERFSPYIVSAAFPGLVGETFLRILDDHGIAVSTGSACSGSGKKRRVLQAMQVPVAQAQSSIRISIGSSTSPAEIDRFLEIAQAQYQRYRT